MTLASYNSPDEFLLPVLIVFGIGLVGLALLVFILIKVLKFLLKR